MRDRLVIGTAQLGMPYGINNISGQPNIDSACDIVKTAFDNGITRFDTAQAYGASEEVLGRAFDKFKISAKVKVYSKLHPKLGLRDDAAVRLSVEDSLRKLKIDRLEGLLVHCEDGLRFWAEGLGNVLRALVVQGKVKSIGASFYTPQKAFLALDIDEIDMIQVPANILDRRFEDGGVFKKAIGRGKEVFVRSVFLQGLLLMEPKTIPEKLRMARNALTAFRELASRWRFHPNELALKYVLSKWSHAWVVVGAETARQVSDNVRAAGQDLPQDCISEIDRAFEGTEERIINPANWVGMNRI